MFLGKKKHAAFKWKDAIFEFPVCRGSAEALLRWGGKIKYVLIAYFPGNIFAKNCCNRTICVKIIASQRWNVFWDTVYIYIFGCSCPVTEFCQAQNSLCVQVLRSPILATLLHSSQAVGVSRTAAFSRGRHLYLAGRPSHWASAHILVNADTAWCGVVALDSAGDAAGRAGEFVDNGHRADRL